MGTGFIILLRKREGELIKIRVRLLIILMVLSEAFKEYWGLVI